MPLATEEGDEHKVAVGNERWKRQIGILVACC
jgi:hypothetical protein